MMLTRAADYAVRVMVCLAGKPEYSRTHRDALADAAQVPPEFLGKVLQSLNRAGLITSQRGVNGGFALARPGDSISMLNVIEAVEGPLRLNVCLLDDPKCNRRDFCAAHRVWCEAQEALERILSSVTIATLAREASQPKIVEAVIWN